MIPAVRVHGGLVSSSKPNYYYYYYTDSLPNSGSGAAGQVTKSNGIPTVNAMESLQ